MSSKLYSALGEIIKAVHIYPKECVTSDNITDSSRRNKKTVGIYSGIDNAFVEIDSEFYIVLRANDDVIESKNDDPEAYQYLVLCDPVKYAGTFPGVETFWTQDVFEFFPWKNQLLYCRNQEFVYENMVKEIFSHSEIEITPAADLTPGGNVLIGNSNEKDYVLTSNNNSLDLLSERFEIATNDCINLNFSYDKMLRLIFFHTDMFLTIIGPVNAKRYKGKEILLLAKAKSDDKELENQINDVLDEIEKQLSKKGKEMNLPFKIIRTTMYVIKDVSEENNPQAIGFTMNNCIVENYGENGKRKINLLVPDFNQSITSYINALPDFVETRKEIYNRLFNLDFEKASLEEGFALNPINYISKSASEQINDVFNKELKSLKTDRIIKTDCDFYSMAKNKQAGLHCLVKVVERNLP